MQKEYEILYNSDNTATLKCEGHSGEKLEITFKLEKHTNDIINNLDNIYKNKGNATLLSKLATNYGIGKYLHSTEKAALVVIFTNKTVHEEYWINGERILGERYVPSLNFVGKHRHTIRVGESGIMVGCQYWYDFDDFKKSYQVVGLRHFYSDEDIQKTYEIVEKAWKDVDLTKLKPDISDKDKWLKLCKDLKDKETSL